MPDGVTVSVVDFSAHGREPGGTAVTFRFPDGRATAYIFDRSRGITRLPSGDFVVEESRQRKVTVIESRATLPWASSELVLPPGAFRISADATIQPFSTLVGSPIIWGSNRVWGWSGPRRVVGSDMDARPFFRIRQDADVLGIMPFRDGVCLARADGKIRCFDLEERMMSEVRVEGLRSAVVDRSGRVYAMGDDKIVAFGPDGVSLWEDAIEGGESNLVLAPSLGLCHLARGASLVCYAPIEDAGETGRSARRTCAGGSDSTNAAHCFGSRSTSEETSGTSQPR